MTFGSIGGLFLRSCYLAEVVMRYIIARQLVGDL